MRSLAQHVKMRLPGSRRDHFSSITNGDGDGGGLSDFLFGIYNLSLRKVHLSTSESTSLENLASLPNTVSNLSAGSKPSCEMLKEKKKTQLVSLNF